MNIAAVLCSVKCLQTERRLFANKERVNNKVDNLERSLRAGSCSHDFKEYGTNLIKNIYGDEIKRWWRIVKL